MELKHFLVNLVFASTFLLSQIKNHWGNRYVAIYPENKQSTFPLNEDGENEVLELKSHQ